MSYSQLLHGKEFNDVFMLDGGPMQVIAMVEVLGKHVTLRDATFYPLTSARMELGVRDVLRVFRSVSDQAAAEGFSSVSVMAYRSGGARPGRMMDVTRRVK